LTVWAISGVQKSQRVHTADSFGFCSSVCRVEFSVSWTALARSRLCSMSVKPSASATSFFSCSPEFLLATPTVGAVMAKMFLSPSGLRCSICSNMNSSSVSERAMPSMP
jgi:hypothetical protein